MPSQILHEAAKKYAKKRPDLQVGATVRVHERIQEGEKTRTQIFEGLIISLHRGHSLTDQMFTVRRIASGVGVERVFAVHSPVVEKIDVKKIAKVRRAKLNFLRGRRGKSARLSERFTTDDEFAVAVASEEVTAPKEEEIIQKAANDPERKEEDEAKEMKEGKK
jgi:large subunit ribosomal protein L19